MEIVKNKEKTLYYIFLKYLISFCLLTFLSIFLPLTIVSVGINKGVLLQANYGEKNIEALRNELININKFNEDKIPTPYQYVFYDKNLEIINSNLSEHRINEAYRYLKGERFNSNYIYSKLEIDDGIYVIAYDIRLHFASQKLNELFPFIEPLTVILM